MMLRKIYLLLLISCPLATYGQFGANARYLIGQSEYLDEVFINQNGMQVSLEYAFRLKEKRLEFHPGIGYRFTFYEDGNYYGEDAQQGYFHSIDLDLNTSIYPFDFGGDCDCPTFSKEGNFIKKGFFIEASPGVGYQTLKRKWSLLEPGEDRPAISSSNIVFKLGFGAGIDIGLTEDWTITPIFNWTRIFPEEWDGLGLLEETETLEDQTYLGAGLRVAYKPDDRRRRRY